MWWIMFHHSRHCLGFGNYSLPTRFNCLAEPGMGDLEGRIGLPALQPVLYFVPPGFAWAERGMGTLYTSIPGL